jgi:acetolactate synthase I/II/III large subunit
MKLSDVVAQFLAEEGIRHVFAISGGASLHLIHSIAETPGTTYVCPQHEQAGAMAADGYARVSGGLGCAVATSGPGATNLITGICSSYYDSVPVLYLTGQVATFRAKGDTGVRQMGFQETDTVDICRTITKSAVLVTDPYRIRYELQRAVAIAKGGRPGPVLVDIPDDLQRLNIDPTKLIADVPVLDASETPVSDVVIDDCIAAVRAAKRPLIVYGWGVHLAKAEMEACELAQLLGVPVALTWAARDLMAHDDPLAVGGFGTHGVRFANFAVQNADLVLSVGSRLDTKATGSPPSTFAREARIIMVDIDQTEIGKFARFGVKLHLGVVADARSFLRALLRRVREERFPDFAPWLERILDWKRRYPACLPNYADETTVNPYWFVNRLSHALDDDEIIFSDTGCALAWMMQGFEFKRRQRFFHAFNNTPMGYSLPGAIGAGFARPGRRIICIAGDGSLQMNIQELITVIRHQLPIKILLINNHGHSMVQQTQEMWLGANYYATSIEGGLAFPDFVAVAKAYGFPADTVSRNADIPTKLAHALASDGPYFLNIDVDPAHRVLPQVKFGRPNEDADPLLPRNEFLENMIVSPLPVSLREA